MPVSGILANYHMTVLENMLNSNPTALYFPQINAADFPFSKFPQGVPRQAVLNAFLNHAAESKKGQTLPSGQTLPFSNQAYGYNTGKFPIGQPIIRAEDVA